MTVTIEGPVSGEMAAALCRIGRKVCFHNERGELVGAGEVVEVNEIDDETKSVRLRLDGSDAWIEIKAPLHDDEATVRIVVRSFLQ